MIIVKATISDLSEIMSIYEDGQAFLKKNGVNQWINGYPSVNLIADDINNKRLYMVLDNNEIIAVYVLIGKEPTYKFIENGNWISDDDYVTVHRICVKNSRRNQGIASYIFDDIKKSKKHIRIDTHRDNQIMNHLLKSNNFTYRGIIYLDNGDERNAYEYYEK